MSFFTPAFLDWLVQRADVYRGGEVVNDTTGESAKPYALHVAAVPCQYQVAQGAMARLSYGERPQEFGTVYFQPGLDLAVGDKVILDGDGVVLLVESVKRPRDGGGVDHLEAQVSRRPVL